MRATPVNGVEPAIRSLDFASCFVYAPSGASALSARSRSLCAMIKTAEPSLVPLYARCVARQARRIPMLARFFQTIDVLIPIPACKPSREHREDLPRRLAEALVAEGLATSVWNGLHRIRAVPKSATAPPGRRPTVRAHYDSLRVAPGPDLPDHEHLLLVDDVVTKGRTLLAAAIRLHEAFPGVRISAFALMRTRGFKHDLEGLLEPCVGRIGWRAGEAHRNP
jgi:predicted amidophosphoribosyltransferase